MVLNNSVVICVPDICPAVPYVSFPGLSLASFIRSATERNEEDDGITSTYGEVATKLMPVKSFTGSYGAFVVACGRNAIVDAEPKTSVFASAGASKAIFMAINPLAPARLSTTMVLEICLDKFSEIRRAIKSTCPPGANGTITRMGLVSVCAAETAATSIINSALTIWKPKKADFMVATITSLDYLIFSKDKHAI